MASNPLLLTVMAALHYKETELPTERAALYEKLIELLLGLWRRHQLDADAAYEEWNVDRLRDERNNIEDLALLMQMRPAEADARLEQVRLYLRLAHDLKLLTLRQYEHVSREIGEVGALLGDWIKRMSEIRTDMH